MKILFISEYFPTDQYLDVHGGMEMRTYYVAKLLSYKHQVWVITSRLESKSKNKQINGINVIYAGITRSYSYIGSIGARIIFSISAIYLGLFTEFDLVEGSGLLGWFPAYILGILKKKKKVIIVADVSENYLTGFLKYMISRFEKFIFKVSWNKIICISNTIKNYLTIYGIQEKSIETIYCGIDDKISNLSKKTNEKFNIVCVSRLVPYKRVLDLVKAVHLLSQKYPQIKLEIIGDGEEYKNIYDYINKYKLKNNIRLLGFIKKHQEVMDYIKRAYIFCLPSIVEGFGIVTIESLAQGVPVILADLPIHHEITENKGVIFFDPKNYIDLADKLENVWEDEILYKKLCTQGHEVSKQYTWQKTANKTGKLYEYLCSN